jgi:CheY-like chemotaxis protein
MARTGYRLALIADDEPAIRELLASLLADEMGFAVIQVADGTTALARLLVELPDVLVLDHRMPGCDGFEVARRLRADPATRGVPILGISAHAAAEDALAAGCDRFIRKPFDLDEVVAAVHALVGT